MKQLTWINIVCLWSYGIFLAFLTAFVGLVVFVHVFAYLLDYSMNFLEVAGETMLFMVPLSFVMGSSTSFAIYLLFKKGKIRDINRALTISAIILEAILLLIQYITYPMTRGGSL